MADDFLPPPAYNPYQAPTSNMFEDVVIDQSNDDNAIRVKYIDTESTVKTIGLIYLIGCGISLVTTVLFVSSDRYLAAVAGTAPGVSVSMLRMFAIIGAGIGLLFGLLFGIGLRALINGIRIVVMIFTVLQFAFSLFGQFGQLAQGGSWLDSATLLVTLGLFLYFTIFLGKPRTRFVFTPEYKAVISRTRDIKPAIGARDKILLILYLAIMVVSTAVQARRMF